MDSRKVYYTPEPGKDSPTGLGPNDSAISRAHATCVRERDEPLPATLYGR